MGREDVMPYANPGRARDYQREYRRLRRGGEARTTPCTTPVPAPFRLASRQRIVSFRATVHRFVFGGSGRERIAAFCVGPYRFSRSSRDPSATPPSIRRGTTRWRRQTT